MRALIDQVLILGRRFLPYDSFIRRRWRAYRAIRLSQSPRGKRLLEVFAATYPRAFFIQIGSNDGIKLDPLRKHILAGGWRGILIEPIPDLFRQLQRGYAGCEDRLRFENLAIADRDGILPFYHLAPVADFRAEGLPDWYDALGSFRREVIAAHVTIIPDIEQRIVKRDVPAVTFDTLCTNNHVTQLDLLHMDTEGYDYQLLQHIDFSRYCPRLVIFEHIHLKQEDRSAAVRLMSSYGYECMQEGMDIWCLRTRGTGPKDQPLLELWHRFLAA